MPFKDGSFGSTSQLYKSASESKRALKFRRKIFSSNEFEFDSKASFWFESYFFSYSS